jgi:hypothetical protein
MPPPFEGKHRSPRRELTELSLTASNWICVPESCARVAVVSDYRPSRFNC